MLIIVCAHGQAIADTTSAYNTELERQRVNDTLCKEFASVADPLSQWIVSTKDHVSEAKESLEAQLHYVEERITTLPEDGERVSQVYDLQAKLDERLVTNNRHTTLIAKVAFSSFAAAAHVPDHDSCSYRITGCRSAVGPVSKLPHQEGQDAPE